IFLEFVHREVLRRHLTLDLASALTQAQGAFNDPREFTAFPRFYRDTVVRRAAEVTALSLALSSTKVDDAAIRAFYDANRDQFQQTCVRHILLPAKDQADQAAPAIRAQLEQQSQASLNDFLDKAVPASRVTVNPRYGRFQKEGLQPGVVPPNAPSVPTSSGKARTGPGSLGGTGAAGGGAGATGAAGGGGTTGGGQPAQP